MGSEVTTTINAYGLDGDLAVPVALKDVAEGARADLVAELDLLQVDLDRVRIRAVAPISACATVIVRSAQAAATAPIRLPPRRPVLV